MSNKKLLYELSQEWLSTVKEFDKASGDIKELKSELEDTQALVKEQQLKIKNARARVDKIEELYGLYDDVRNLHYMLQSE
jgi:uncharacterized coiled-coil DUF342 family protein